MGGRKWVRETHANEQNDGLSSFYRRHRRRLVGPAARGGAEDGGGAERIYVCLLMIVVCVKLSTRWWTDRSIVVGGSGRTDVVLVDQPREGVDGVIFLVDGEAQQLPPMTDWWVEVLE